MLDTVILSIPRHKIQKLALVDNDTPQWSLQKKGKGHEVHIKNGPKQYKKTDPYYPRLTGYSRKDPRTGLEIKMVKIEFSVAKLIYNNNLDEVQDKDFPLVVSTLRERLLQMGEAVSKDDIINASVSAFDPSKNVPLSDGYTACHVIRELSKINVNKKLDLSKVTFKNDGQGLQIYSKNYSVVFYDKIADLNQKKGRAIDKDQTPMQLSLFEEIKEKAPFTEILRIEIRLRNKQKMNSVLEIIEVQPDPKFKDIFKKDVCQKVVRWYWDTIIKGENLFLFELENNPKRILRKILQKKNPTNFKEAIYFVGLNLLCKDEGGIRELRQLAEKRMKTRNWYRIGKHIKELNAFAEKTGLHGWVNQTETCLQKFETYKAVSP